MRIAVLVSGSGTLLTAMINNQLPVEFVVADRQCKGLGLAQKASIGNALVERTEWGSAFDRVEYSTELAEALVDREIDVVAMAGFGTILTQPVFDAFPNRILNTHPSLLPSFPGWHAVRDALSAGVDETGCTIHLATTEVDQGPIVAQRRVKVESSDDEPTLHERIKVVERDLYVSTLRKVIDESINLDSLGSIPSAFVA